MNNPGDRPQRRRYHAARDVGALLLLALLIFTLHWRSLHYGLFMDDHVHCRQLRECGWSLTELTDACRLELVGGPLDAWFMPDCTLRFFRPLAFGLMKLTYTLTGWNPLAMHVASLGWHLLVCVLLMRLLRKLGSPPLLAWAVAGLFAIHPGHVATVEWLACQTELMATAFLLGAMLCYLRFRGWSEKSTQTGGSLLAGIASVVFFAAALGCRENAIMFPLVILAAEPALRRRWSVRIASVYAALVIVGGVYLVLRWTYLGDASLPPKPYVTPPGDPEFVRFVFDKACYYLLGEFLLAPSVPLAGLEYLRARPLALYGLAALVVLLLVAICRRRWGGRSGLLGTAWLLGFMLPVLPVFAAPHHLYLPGIGWAIAAMHVFRNIGGRSAATKRLRPATMWVAIVLVGFVFGAGTLSLSESIDVAQRVEDLLTAEIVSRADDLHDGDTLCVANFPIIAYCVPVAVEEQTGLRNLRFEVLTWAPRVLGLVGTDVRSEITWVDQHTIDVRIAGDRYFAGPLGRLAAGTLFAREMPAPKAHRCVRASALEQDDDGIAALRFELDRPVSDPGVHLFWGSRLLWAFELKPPVTP